MGAELRCLKGAGVKNQLQAFVNFKRLQPIKSYAICGQITDGEPQTTDNERRTANP